MSNKVGALLIAVFDEWEAFHVYHFALLPREAELATSFHKGKEKAVAAGGAADSIATYPPRRGRPEGRALSFWVRQRRTNEGWGTRQSMSGKLREQMS
jgi:hypothetical protein